MAGTRVFTDCVYNFKGVDYCITESNEVHQQLQNDLKFFEEYVQMNLSIIETVRVTDEDNELTPTKALSTSTLDESNFMWNSKNSKLLLHEYRHRKSKFRDPKIKKKLLWCEIKNIFHNHGYTAITEDELDKKFRNMKKRYRTIKDNNKKTTTGRGRITWEYFELMEDLFYDDKTVNFGPTISSLNTVQHQPSATIISSTPIPHFSPSIQISHTADFIHSPSENEIQINIPSLSEPLPSLVPSPSLLEPLVSPVLSSFESSSSKKEKAGRSKALYNLRKKTLELEEARIEAIRNLKESIDENNAIQKERNEILKSLLQK